MNYSYYLFEKHFGDTGTPHHEGNVMKENYSETREEKYERQEKYEKGMWDRHIDGLAKPKVPLRRSIRIRENKIISDLRLKEKNLLNK